MSDQNEAVPAWSKAVTIVTALQVVGVVAGVAAVIVLKMRGIRFFGFVPTFVLVFIPLFAGSAARIVVGKRPKSAWIAWTIGLILALLATAYAALGETPSAIL